MEKENWNRENSNACLEEIFAELNIIVQTSSSDDAQTQADTRESDPCHPHPPYPLVSQIV